MTRYLDGALSARRARGVEAHLAACEACRRKARLFDATARLAEPARERLDAVTRNVMERVRQSGGTDVSDMSSSSPASTASTKSTSSTPFAFAAWRTDSPILGEITSVEGVVLVRRSAEDKGIEAFPGLGLREGDRLEPLDGGSAAVTWEDGGRVVVNGSFDVRRATLEPRPAANLSRRTIMLNRRTKRFALASAWAMATGVAIATFMVSEPMFVNFKGNSDGLPDHSPNGVVDPHLYAFDPTNGTVSGGDVWRVKDGGPAGWENLQGRAFYLKKTPRSQGGGTYGTEWTVRNGSNSPQRGQPRENVQRAYVPNQPKSTGHADESVLNMRFAREVDEFNSALEPPQESVVSGGDVWRINTGEQIQGWREWYDPTEQASAEAYDSITENNFLDVRREPLSTFAIDVDTASYSNMRRFLNQGQRPPRSSVRIEELINYFPYELAPPADDTPFTLSAEAATCPWNDAHRLVRLALKGRVIANEQRPAANLVFLLDVSGSMDQPNKLPLVKESMRALLGKLGAADRVAIATYATQAGIALDSASCADPKPILAAIDALRADGSTNGAGGIQLAYEIALRNFIRGGVNRVILATDGDFNVGITDQETLVKMIEAEAQSGIFLTVLGFGMDNLKDSTLEKLADKGNGHYAYIDTVSEARKALVEEVSGTLVTIAKDVKIQVEFNPAAVGAYRLIGYENRALKAEDFNNDAKDAGEIGAGHEVTALYEIVPPGAEAAALAATPTSATASASEATATASAREETSGSRSGAVDALRYQTPGQQAPQSAGGEILTVKVRYKAPDADVSRALEFPVSDAGRTIDQVSADFKFAAAVASFVMMLRDSAYKGNTTFDSVARLAIEGKGADPWGYRAEFIDLVGKAKTVFGQ
jgi:Ca-activated chloride channel family protein